MARPTFGNGMKAHPSGRPIRNERIVGQRVWRIPDKGAVTPRLQDDQSNLSAVGFMARLTARKDDE